MKKLIRVLSVFFLGLFLTISFSFSASAQSPDNYNPSGNSGAYYQGYLEYMSPSIKADPPRVIDWLLFDFPFKDKQSLYSQPESADNNENL